MNSKIIDAIRTLQPSLESSLRKSIQSVINSSNPYGYALLLGEDIDQSDAIAVTNTESELLKVDDEEIIDMRYIPDEWADWHQNHFAEFNEKLASVYQEFESTHQVTNDECYYTEDAIEYMNELYNLYLTSIKSVKNEFNTIWYWIIWISDSDREIINKSFYALNTGRALEEAKTLFED